MTAAERLSACLDELASSVHRAGVPAEASARLLELAALATMRALELDLRLAGRNRPSRRSLPGAGPGAERLTAGELPLLCAAA